VFRKIIIKVNKAILYSTEINENRQKLGMMMAKIMTNTQQKKNEGKFKAKLVINK